MKYDSTICITAEELRDIGIEVPETIPDCAWVPRWALRFSVGEVVAVDATRYTTNCRIGFAQPFRWVESEVTL